jgi:hypothetical protein
MSIATLGCRDAAAPAPGLLLETDSTSYVVGVSRIILRVTNASTETVVLSGCFGQDPVTGHKALAIFALSEVLHEGRWHRIEQHSCRDEPVPLPAGEALNAWAVAQSLGSHRFRVYLLDGAGRTQVGQWVSNTIEAR